MDGNGRWAEKARPAPFRRSCGGRAEFPQNHALLLADRHSLSHRVRLLHRKLVPPRRKRFPRSCACSASIWRKRCAISGTTTLSSVFLGDISAFSAPLRELITETQELSASRSGMVLNIAMNYGGRAELTHAFQDLARRCRRVPCARRTSRRSAFPPRFTRRPAGPGSHHPAQRGTPHQQFSAVAVGLCGICDYGYPVADFRPADLDAALREYANRSRRFGGI